MKNSFCAIVCLGALTGAITLGAYDNDVLCLDYCIIISSFSDHYFVNGYLIIVVFLYGYYIVSLPFGMSKKKRN